MFFVKLNAVGLMAGLVLIACAPSEDTVAGPTEYHSLECMALNIYFEAPAGDTEGQRAVGHVTMNRMTDPRFPDTVCDVVHQGPEGTLHGCQFHWWCDGRSDEPTNSAKWGEAVEVAQLVMAGDDPDPTDGALYFHNTQVEPSWASKLERTVQIGPHIFYR